MSHPTSLEQQIDALLSNHPEICGDVRNRFSDFWQEVEGDDGECTETFGKVIPKGTFTQSFQPPDPLPTVVVPVRDVLVSAAILARIYAVEVIDQASGEKRPSGWAGLNKDAKGWCRSLLTAQPPVNATIEELRDLVTAKSLVGLLAANGIPSGLRTDKVPPRGKGPDMEGVIDE
jgi:hypothetical protein